MLGPADENRSKSNKLAASDLPLETNSIANTIVLLPYVVLPSILRNNRSWHQIVRLLDMSAFPVKAQLTKVGRSKKRNSLTRYFLVGIQYAKLPLQDS